MEEKFDKKPEYPNNNDTRPKIYPGSLNEQIDNSQSGGYTGAPQMNIQNNNSFGNQFGANNQCADNQNRNGAYPYGSQSQNTYPYPGNTQNQNASPYPGNAQNQNAYPYPNNNPNQNVNSYSNNINGAPNQNGGSQVFNNSSPEISNSHVAYNITYNMGANNYNAPSSPYLQPNQPGYTPPKVAEPGSGMAKASLTMSLISLLACYPLILIPFVNAAAFVIGAVLSLLALIFGIVGTVRLKRKGLAIAGTVLSVISLAISVTVIALAGSQLG